jgi:glycosyltransferase involved in cell wall biosynthesis
MAAGAPVVVSATGGLTDLVSSPTVGCQFPVGDHVRLAEILFGLCGDRAQRQALGQAGARHIVANFAWSIIAKRAVGFYAEAQKPAKAALKIGHVP